MSMLEKLWYEQFRIYFWKLRKCNCVVFSLDDKYAKSKPNNTLTTMSSIGYHFGPCLFLADN